MAQMVFIAFMAIKKVCSVRKENELYLYVGGIFRKR